MEPLPVDSVLVQNQHYLAPDGNVFVFLGDDYLPNAYVNITGGTTPVDPTNRAGAIPGAVTDALVFTGNLTADVDNTSLFYADNAAVNAPPFADTDGGAVTITGSNGAKRQLWFGRNGVLGIRGSDATGTYDPWVQIPTSITEVDTLETVSNRGNITGDNRIWITGNLSPIQVADGLSFSHDGTTSHIEHFAGGANTTEILMSGTMLEMFHGTTGMTMRPETTTVSGMDISARVTVIPAANVGEVFTSANLGANLTWDDTNNVIDATGGITNVNIGYTASPTNGVVTNSAGDNATLLAATGTNAGLLLPGEKTTVNERLLPIDKQSVRMGPNYSDSIDAIAGSGLFFQLATTPDKPWAGNFGGMFLVGASAAGTQTPKIGVGVGTSPNDDNLWYQSDAGETWYQAASTAYVDTNAVQNLQSVTTTGLDGNVTTATIQHASATEPNQSLTGENLGFALGWNGNTLEFDWGNTQTVGANTLHFVDLNPNESISFGSPLGTSDPLFHLAYGATPEDSEWQLRTTAATATNAASFIGNQNTLELSITNASDQSKAITISRLGSMQVLDGISQVGLVNNGDYEPNFVPRSLVTKQYADGLIFFTEVSADFPATAANSFDTATNAPFIIPNAEPGDLVLVNSTDNLGVSQFRALVDNLNPGSGEVLITRYNVTNSGVSASTYTMGVFLIKQGGLT